MTFYTAEMQKSMKVKNIQKKFLFTRSDMVWGVEEGPVSAAWSHPQKTSREDHGALRSTLLDSGERGWGGQKDQSHY